jgi:outer membrane protein assembly factor BamB
VFGKADGTNRLDNLFDGATQGGENCVMWDTDQTVTVTLDFRDPYDLSRLELQAWFATASSKNKLFQLKHLTVEASHGNFAADTRKVLDYEDTETHPNWGDPAHGPQRYPFPDFKTRARQLRLRLTPRPGTAIYLAELQVWGNREGGLEALPAAKRQGLPIHTFRALAAADLDGDGNDELITGSTNKRVAVFDHTGKLLWQYEAGDAITSVAAVALGGPGKLAVVAGSLDTHVYALSPDGKLLWTFTPPYYKRAPKIRVVFGADLTGDGKQAVIAGSESWHYFALDASGQEIWRCESVHASTAGCAGDLDGDGKDEVVCGTEYYWWPVVNPDGKVRFSYSSQTGPHANAAAVGDLNGDGKREVIFGGADTNVTALSNEGKLLFQLNTGDEVRALAVADLDGDGKQEVLVASASFNVYALKGDVGATGRSPLLWRRDLGEEARVVIAADVNGDGRPEAVVGDGAGRLLVLRGADGQPLAGLNAGAVPLALAALKEGRNLLVAVSTEDGNLAALQMK